MEVGKSSIKFGSIEISFEIQYKNRKTLGITIYPDNKILVSAPFNSSLLIIKEKVRKKARWIIKQQDHFRKFHPFPLPKRYVSGETFRYLGRQYRLKLVSEEVGAVKIKSGYVHVGVKDKEDKKAVRKILEKWYRERALIKFNERLKANAELLEKMNCPYPRLKLKEMKKRWGSYLSSGVVVLNPFLIEAPVYCIDYIILHEVCHSKFPNHGKKFFSLLQSILPDWENRKKRLEKIY